MDEPSFHPIALTGFRIITGFIVFGLLYIIFVRERIDRRDIPLIIGCGLTGVAINMTLFLLGLNYTNPINASLVMSTSPVMVVIFSVIIINEKVSKLNILGIALALSGAIYLVYKPEQLFSIESMKGDIMIFLNGVSYALYFVLVKKLIKKYKPFTLLMLIYLVGFTAVIPFSIPYMSQIEWSSFNQPVYLSFAFVLIGITCITYLLNVFAIQFVKASTASSYIYLQPVLATFFAIMMKKDVFTMKIALCSCLIFAGLYLVSNKKSK